jgi:O-antigen ligase
VRERVTGVPSGGASLISVVFVVVAIVAAGLASWRDDLAVPIAAGVVVAVIAALDWRIPVLLAALVLPTSVSLTTPVGFVAVSDALLLAGLLGALVRGDLMHALRIRAVRVIAGALGLYLVLALALGFASGTDGVVVEVAVRTMFWIPPLLAGAALADRDGVEGVRWMLSAYLVGSVAVAVSWLLSPFAGTVLFTHKNGAGQTLALAVLIIASSLRPRSRPLAVAIAIICGAGLIATGSRGAILSLALGLVVLVVLSVLRQATPGRIVTSLGVVIVAVAVLTVLSETILARVAAFSTDYTVQIRLTFWTDAIGQTVGREWIGNGVGAYAQQSSSLQRVLTLDPHNVYVLTYFEGGILLLLSFAAAMVTILVVLLRLRRTGGAAVLAATMQIVLLAHTIIDVYWSRGAVTLPFVVAGLAVGIVAASTTGDDGAGRLPPLRAPAHSGAHV